MADYKEMYLTLFRSFTKAINILQTAQMRTEQMYEDARDIPIDIADFTKKEDEE